MQVVAALDFLTFVYDIFGYEFDVAGFVEFDARPTPVLICSNKKDGARLEKC